MKLVTLRKILIIMLVCCLLVVAAGAVIMVAGEPMGLIGIITGAVATFPILGELASTDKKLKSNLSTKNPQS